MGEESSSAYLLLFVLRNALSNSGFLCYNNRKRRLIP